MSRDRTIDVRVTEIEQVSPLIRRYTLEAADGGLLPAFSGGAHIVVELDDGERVLRNPYSLVGSPWDSRRYRIAVRRSEQGASGACRMHEKLRAGARLRISRPVNLFPLARTGAKHLLVAGGVGVTPFFAHLAELRALEARHELHYAARSADEAAFAEELGRMLGERLHLYLSDEGRRIDFPALLARQPAGTHLYVCGPQGMVEAAFAAARAAGWPENRIHAEAFARPPRLAPHTVPTRSASACLAGAETGPPPERALATTAAAP